MYKYSQEIRERIRKEAEERFIKKSIIIHKGKYDYSLVKFTVPHTKVKIICPIHGVFEQSTRSHCNEKHGCKQCQDSRLRKTTEEFISEAKKVHGDRYDYSLVDYKNGNIDVKIICKEHGIFEQWPQTHCKDHGCPKCKETKGERRVRQYLEKQNIEYNPQKYLEGCINPKSKRRLYFDFYIPKHNLCIEFDGSHHFLESVGRFNWNAGRLEKTQFRDNIKNEHCKSNNIKLLRISYLDYNKIETIIEKFIQDLYLESRHSYGQ
jgi:hypothetical protein